MTLYDELRKRQYTLVKLTAETQSWNNPNDRFIARAYIGDIVMDTAESKWAEEAVRQLLFCEPPSMNEMERWLTTVPGRSYILTTDEHSPYSTDRDDQRVILLNPYSDADIQ